MAEVEEDLNNLNVNDNVNDNPEDNDPDPETLNEEQDENSVNSNNDPPEEVPEPGQPNTANTPTNTQPSVSSTHSRTHPSEVKLETKSKKLPPKLKELTEYPLWKTQMILHFRAENTWSIVSGLEEEPEGSNPEDLSARTKHNMRASKAFGDLLNCLGEKFIELAATFTSVTEAWNEIRTLCEVTNSQKVYALQTAIESFEFSAPATSCLVKLRTLYRELEQRGGKVSQTQKSVKILSILPSEYSELAKTIRTSTLYQASPRPEGTR